MLAYLESLRDTLARYQGLIGFVVIIFGPSLLGQVLSFVRRRRQPPNPLGGVPSREPLTLAVKAVVALHLLYATYKLALPPYDVFTSHGLTIFTPTEALRPFVLRAAGLPVSYSPPEEGSSHPLIDLLLSRLTTLDNRVSYVRWGHGPFLTCVWCKDATDFALASLPSILGPYVAQAALLGTLGWAWVGGPLARVRAESYRILFGVGLLALAAAEYAVRYSLDVRPPKGQPDCLHLAPLIFKVRTVLLCLATLGYVLLPLSQRDASQQTLLRTLESAMNTSRMASLVRTAVVHSPVLARVTAERGEQRARAEEAVLTNPAVIEAAQGVGVFAGNDYTAAGRQAAHDFVDREWARVVRTSA